MNGWLHVTIAAMPEWEAEHALTLSLDEFYARYWPSRTSAGPYFPSRG